MALYRAQILLEQSQHEQLERLAHDSGRSMSDLMRQIVATHLDQTAEEEADRRSLAAIDALATLRRQIETKSGCLPSSLLDELREERDAELIP